MTYNFTTNCEDVDNNEDNIENKFSEILHLIRKFHILGSANSIQINSTNITIPDLSNYDPKNILCKDTYPLLEDKIILENKNIFRLGA